MTRRQSLFPRQAGPRKDRSRQDTDASVEPHVATDTGGSDLQPLTPARTARLVLLEQGSMWTGAQWSACWRDDLRRQGRTATGGWPGTLSEARARVAAFFLRELSRRSMVALTPEEREWAAREAYRAARQDWLTHAVRDKGDP